MPGLLVSHHFVGRRGELLWLEEKLKLVAQEVVSSCVGIYGMFFRMLSKMSNWLLLVDNIGQDEVDTIRHLLPANSSGHVIISSQRRSVVEDLTDSVDNLIELVELNLNESIETFTASRYEPLQNNNELAAEIVKEVGLLPHAIEQVASYIKFNHLDMRTFLQTYRQTPNLVLEWDDGHTRHRSSVAKHFSMILQMLEECYPDALEVLKFYSILETKAIPRFDTWNRTNEEPGFRKRTEPQLARTPGETKALEMVREPESHLEEIFRDKRRREVAIRRLCDLNLLRRVNITVRASIPAANTDMLITCGMSVMYHMFPLEDTTAIDRILVDLFLPQCKTLISQAKARSIPVTNVSHGALPIYIEYLGLENNRTVSLIHKLAKDLFRQALTLRESTFGPDALETLELKEAELIGYEYAGTIVAAHNLGLCYHNQGPLYPSGEQRESIEGIGTLKTLSNLAATIDHQGRLNEAQSLCDKALPEFIKILGFDHFLTVRLRGNIADLLRQQGAFMQAEDMIKGFETITILYELGEVLHAKGDLQAANNAYEEAIGLCFLDASAEEMSRKAYNRFHQMLGWDDPYTLVAANDFGEVLYAEGKYEEAQDIFEKCLVSLGKLVGKQHPHYLMVTNNLGRTSWALGTGEPLDYFDEVYRGLDSLLGPNHFCTFTVGLNQARARAARGEFEPAREVIRTIQNKLQASISDGYHLIMVCDLILGLVAVSEGGPKAFLLARKHLINAIEIARKAEQTHSADYFLGICLLVLVLRELKADGVTIRRYSDQLDSSSPAIQAPSPWFIPGHGAVSVHDFLVMEPKALNWARYIPLATGENIRLRWGRKCCWREAEKVQIMG
ncbi:hypothetical protein F4825DRAFT_467478 [Nemania diffusa]|nr:hypothetical protein F4825DRAFT_467478 [Nemania diffusa]